MTTANKTARLLRVLPALRRNSVYTGQFIVTPGVDFENDDGGAETTNFLIVEARVDKEGKTIEEQHSVLIYPCNAFAMITSSQPIHGSMVGTTRVTSAFKALGYGISVFSEEVRNSYRKMYDVGGKREFQATNPERVRAITVGLCKKYDFKDLSYKRSKLTEDDTEWGFRFVKEGPTDKDDTYVYMSSQKWCCADYKAGIYHNLKTYDWLEEAFLDGDGRWKAKIKATVSKIVDEKTEAVIDTSNVIDADLVLASEKS
jgi:hypothetical protein